MCLRASGYQLLGERAKDVIANEYYEVIYIMLSGEYLSYKRNMLKSDLSFKKKKFTEKEAIKQQIVPHFFVK